MTAVTATTASSDERAAKRGRKAMAASARARNRAAVLIGHAARLKVLLRRDGEAQGERHNDKERRGDAARRTGLLTRLATPAMHDKAGQGSREVAEHEEPHPPADGTAKPPAGSRTRRGRRGVAAEGVEEHEGCRNREADLARP